MGFNTQLLIRNADLEAIAADPDFGKVLAGTVLGADIIAYKRRKTATRGAVTNHDLSDKRGAPRADYEIQVSQPSHASSVILSVISGGRLHQTTIGVNTWVGMTALADAMARFGYRSARQGAGFSFVSEPDMAAGGADLDAECNWMGDWSDETFAGAVTAITILNDGLNEIQNDGKLGSKLAAGIRQWWAQERQITELERSQGSRATREIHSVRDIRVRGYGNAVSIVAAVPEGRADILMTEGNLGRMLRPFMNRRQRQSGFSSATQAQSVDLAAAAEALKCAGFTIRRPDRKRSESPYAWSERHWVSPPAEEPTGPEGP